MERPGLWIACRSLRSLRRAWRGMGVRRIRHGPRPARSLVYLYRPLRQRDRMVLALPGRNGFDGVDWVDDLGSPEFQKYPVKNACLRVRGGIGIVRGLDVSWR